MKAYHVLVLLCISYLFGETWNTDGPGQWNNASNWTPASVPNANNAIANFGTIATGPIDVALDANIEVGTINFASDFSYAIVNDAIAPSATLTIGSEITIASNTPPTSISVPLILANNLRVVHNATSTLTLSELGTTGSAFSFTLDGVGEVSLQGDNSLFAGDIVLQSGVLEITNNNSIGVGQLFLGTIGAPSPITLTSTNALSLANEITMLQDTQISVPSGSFLTLTGDVTGSANFTKIGDGTLVLSPSSNTRTGNTILNKGTLQLTNTNSLSSGELTIQDGTVLTNATLAYSNRINVENSTSSIQVDAGTLTLSGPVLGSGELNKIGAGTLLLSNSSNFFGGLNIREGTVLINTTSLGGSPMDIYNNAQLTIDSPNTLLLFAPVNFGSGGGTISHDSTVAFIAEFRGEGLITKTGTGDLRVPVAATNTGGVDILGGRVLALSSAGITLGPVTLADQTSYLFLNTDATMSQRVAIPSGSVFLGPGTADNTVTIDGDITGAGGIELVAGTTILRGNNSYGSGTTGITVPIGTTIGIGSNTALGSQGMSLAGDLRGVADATLTNAIVVSSSNIFSIDDATTLTFDGSITGTSNITKEGSGSAVFNDPNFTGSIIVNNGSLIGNGNASTNPTTLNAGQLGGSGSFGATRVVSGTLFGNGTYNNLDIEGGRIAPGNSVGVITVVGDYTQEAGSVYAVEIDGGLSDQILISGTATINPGAVVTIDQISGTIPKGTVYDILIADGGLNQLWPIQQIDESLEATLTLIDGTTARLITAHSVIFAGRDIQGDNATAITTYLNEIEVTDDPDLLSIILIMDSLDNAELNDALNTLHPSRFAAFALTNMDDHHGAFSLFTTRLAQSRSCFLEGIEDRSHNFWIAPMTTLAQVDPLQDIPGYDAVTGGLVLGYEALLREDFGLGLAASYAYSSIKWPNEGGRSSVNKGWLGSYVGYFLPQFSVDLALLGGISDYKVKRGIVFPGLDRTARHHQGGGFFASHLGLDLVPIGPAAWLHVFFEIDYHYLHQNAYQETGAGSLDLSVGKTDSQFLRQELGLHFQNAFGEEDTCWLLDYSFSWVNKLPLQNGEYQVQFYDYIDDPDNMTIKTINHSIHFFSPQLKLSYQKGPFSFATAYEGEFNDHYKNHLIALELSIGW